MARGDVVLDPGHGGETSEGHSTPIGVTGPRGTLEKNITLAIAQRVQRDLGADAILTRDADFNLSLAARSGLTKRWGSRAFVSIHANRGAPGQRGMEIFVHSRAGEKSLALAEEIRRALSGYGNAAGNIIREELAVLSPGYLAANTAACLVELDYLSDADGESALRDPQRMDQLSGALSRGIRNYTRVAYGERDPAEADHVIPREEGTITIGYGEDFAEHPADETFAQSLEVTSQVRGGTQEADGTITLVVNGLTVTLLHDIVDATLKDAAATLVNVRYSIPEARSFLNVVFWLDGDLLNDAQIWTSYRPTARKNGPTDYGRGTTPEDRRAGNTTLRFHESCHGNDYVEYLRTHALPRFTGSIGQTVDQYEAAKKQYIRDIEAYRTAMVTDTKRRTDCVGTPAPFCPV